MAGRMDGQRIVVTGGAGFIGVHSVEALLDAGADVLVIDEHAIEVEDHCGNKHNVLL